MMASQRVMIEEATKARNEIAGELRQAIEAGNTDREWMADRIDGLAYYNNLLIRLGAIPAL